MQHEQTMSTQNPSFFFFFSRHLHPKPSLLSQTSQQAVGCNFGNFMVTFFGPRPQVLSLFMRSSAEGIALKLVHVPIALSLCDIPRTPTGTRLDPGFLPPIELLVNDAMLRLEVLVCHLDLS